MEKNRKKRPDSRLFYTNVAPGRFSKIKRVACKIAKRGGEEDRYKVVCRGAGGSPSKEIPAVRIEALRFIVRRYMLFVAMFFILLSLYALSFPVYALINFFAISAIFYFYQPHKSISRMEKLQKWIMIYIAVGTAFSLYIMFQGSALEGNVSKKLEMVQGILYGALLIFVATPFLLLLEKYKEVYALGIDSKKQWKKAEFFLWRKGIF